MAAADKVSFTVRRPTPVSRAPSSGADSDASSYKVPPLPRRLANLNHSTSSPKPNAPRFHEPDSSDEDEEPRDELVTAFDRFGAQRFDNDRLGKAAPLVIPALKNRDWRELARKRKSAAQYVPPSAQAETGKDGSLGGLGTRDTINSSPVLSGLQLKGPAVKQEDEVTAAAHQEDVKMEEEEDEDRKALRAILAETNGVEHDGPTVHIIPTPISEAEAYKQDVDELPEPATLEDYARIPVSQFGAALLRGMGWKEGTAATRQPGKGLVEPYLPEARPALLGIGAKEREILDDGSGKKGGAVRRPEKRYVPLVKKEREDRSSTPDDRDERRERSRSPRSHSATSRRSSRSRERGSDRDMTTETATIGVMTGTARDLEATQIESGEGTALGTLGGEGGIRYIARLACRWTQHNRKMCPAHTEAIFTHAIFCMHHRLPQTTER
ncbi:putative G-patch domain containing protein [Lyophyllum shimeji]|uniref:G-patch domain containing protein n=1 Tax=Lyophyllum shimeji TaxID=47721 RepID=A0A9P3PJZ7_LYOSH|nr:putative G-patch domain containing protein [Lyophyllum shimeji]